MIRAWMIARLAALVTELRDAFWQSRMRLSRHLGRRGLAAVD
jgi:hypothetical protein